MTPRDNYYRERSPRARGRNAQGDVITVSIIVRIVICSILLSAVWLTARLNPQRYASFQSQYRALTSEGQSGFVGKVVNKGIGVLEYYWSIVERQANYLFYRQDDAEYPQDALPGAEEWQKDKPVYDFEYNYLEAQEPKLTGQGGGYYLHLGFDSGDTKLYAPSGAVLSPVFSTAKLKPPITGPVTSSFAWRYHPITGTADFHTGMDIAAAQGMPVLAALPGEVVEVGDSQVYGNYIVLQHAENFQTSYSHCSEIIAREGMKVRQGERIAKVGSTGIATGPHLHFSVIVDDMYTDPYWTLKDNLRTEG